MEKNSYKNKTKVQISISKTSKKKTQKTKQANKQHQSLQNKRKQSCQKQSELTRTTTHGQHEH